MFLNFPVLEIVLQIPEGRRETEITDILENDLLDERENDPQNDPQNERGNDPQDERGNDPQDERETGTHTTTDLNEDPGR